MEPSSCTQGECRSSRKHAGLTQQSVERWHHVPDVLHVIPSRSVVVVLVCGVVVVVVVVAAVVVVVVVVVDDEQPSKVRMSGLNLTGCLITIRCFA